MHQNNIDRTIKYFFNFISKQIVKNYKEKDVTSLTLTTYRSMYLLSKWRTDLNKATKTEVWMIFLYGGIFLYEVDKEFCLYMMKLEV